MTDDLVGPFLEWSLSKTLARRQKSRSSDPVGSATIATLAINKGTDLQRTADFLGRHRDKRTTDRYYATHGVPQKIPTLI